MKSKKCKFCDKRIEGWNQKVLDWNMQTHILAKHRDKLEFKTADDASFNSPTEKSSFLLADSKKDSGASQSKEKQTDNYLRKVKRMEDQEDRK